MYKRQATYKSSKIIFKCFFLILLLPPSLLFHSITQTFLCLIKLEDNDDFPTIDIDPLLKADEDVSQCEKSIRNGMQEVHSNFQQN